jgi:predicted phosphodiesterase
VISDTHLGKYDEKKDLFLRELVGKYDRVIINGDFWDSWGTSFQRFVDSEYKKLLDLLKSKDTVYIYGNHDCRAESQKSLGEIFSNNQGIEYDINISGKDFHFEHGHRFFYDQKEVPFINYYRIIDKISFLDLLVYKGINLSYRFFPDRVLKNKVAVSKNNYVKNIKPKGINYVMSHTHIPEIDQEKGFFNTGCIMGKFFSYLVIGADGNVKLMKGKVRK